MPQFGRTSRQPRYPPTCTEIANAYAALGTGPVAVRSSATAEDFAGSGLCRSARHLSQRRWGGRTSRCRTALLGIILTERAIAYRSRIKIDLGVRIAVVVQRMINAEVAGVMFTADPVNGDRETIVVDASSGLGEAVVSGLVTPDHYASTIAA